MQLADAGAVCSYRAMSTDLATPPLISTPDEVSAAWLAAILRASGITPTANIVGFTAESVGTGQMASSVRFALDYDDDSGDAPRSLVCKFASADPISRATGLATRTYEVEVRFYRDIATTVGMRTPRCYFADIDVGTGDFVVALEDIAPCLQGDQLTGCSVDQAALALEELAKLHAPRWGDERLARLPWLHRHSAESIAATAAFLPSLFSSFVERYGPHLQSAHIALGERLLHDLSFWMTSRSAPFSIQHGDYRLDNMLFGMPGQPNPLTVLDWQTVCWGPPVVDASYFLGAGLPVPERRAHEQHLVRVYHDALRAGGVTDFSWDRCWEDYRRYTFSGLLMTIAASMMVVQTERGDEMFLTMARRHATHILDLDGADFLRR